MSAAAIALDDPEVQRAEASALLSRVLRAVWDDDEATLRELHAMYKAAVLTLPDDKGRHAMHFAAYHNKATMIDLLCELGAEASLDHRDLRGCTPAVLAADQNSTVALQRIFDRRPESGLTKVDGATLAHVAARRGHVETLRLLKRNGVVLSAADGMRKTAAHWAAREGRDNVLALLAELEGLLSLQATDVNSTTPAHEAAKKGHVSTLKKLKVLGAPLTATDRDDRTPAHSAALGGHTNVLKALHEFGAPVDTQDIFGRSPLLLAAGKGHVNMLRALVAELGASAQTCDNDGRSAAHWAAINNHAGILEELKTVDGVLQIRTPDGRWPVHDAAAFGSEDALRALHRLGEPLFVRTSRRETAAHEAAKNGHDGILMLLKRFAGEGEQHFFDERTSAGSPTFERSPAHYAAIMGHGTTLRTLKALGATLTDKDGNYMTVAHLAAAHNCGNVLQALYDIDPETTLFETPGPNERLPVSYAAELGGEDVVRVLDKLGAQNTFIVHDDPDLNTPAHFAAEKARVGVLRALFDSSITSVYSVAILQSFSSTNGMENTPASVAVLNNEVSWPDRQRTVEFLAAAGADLFSRDGILLDHIEQAQASFPIASDARKQSSTLLEQLKLAGKEEDPMVRQFYAVLLIGGRFPDVIRSALRANFYEAEPFFRIAFHKFKKEPLALTMLRMIPDDTTKGTSVDEFLREFSKFVTIYPSPPLLQYYSENSQQVIKYLQVHCDKKRQERRKKKAEKKNLKYEAPDDYFNKLPVELLDLILRLVYRPADAYRRNDRPGTPVLRTSFVHLIV